MIWNRTLAAALLLATSVSFAQAQNWPTRPIEVIVPFPAGGSVDVIARAVAQALSEKLNQQFVVSNRVDLRYRQSVPLNDVLVEDFHTARGDRAHRKFGVPWESKLAHDEYVEWSLKVAGDFESDGHAASGQSKHDDIRTVRVAVEV